MRQVQINIKDDTKYKKFVEFIKCIDYIEIEDEFDDDEEIVEKLLEAEEEARSSNVRHSFDEVAKELREKLVAGKI